jgi:hypothetical protein
VTDNDTYHNGKCLQLNSKNINITLSRNRFLALILCLREQGAEENIWTEEGGSKRRLQKTV